MRNIAYDLIWVLKYVVVHSVLVCFPTRWTAAGWARTWTCSSPLQSGHLETASQGLAPLPPPSGNQIKIHVLIGGIRRGHQGASRGIRKPFPKVWGHQAPLPGHQDPKTFGFLVTLPGEVGTFKIKKGNSPQKPWSSTRRQPGETYQCF